MNKKELEQWITKREIQKHSKGKKSYKAQKSISKGFKKSFGKVLKSLDNSIKEAEILLEKL